MSRLTIRHVGDDGFYDGIEIVLTGRFAGVSQLHVSFDDLIAFADRLAEFPVDPERPPAFDQLLATLKLMPSGPADGLRLSVRLVDRRDTETTVSARIPITYQGVRELEQALRAFVAEPSRPLDVEIR